MRRRALSSRRHRGEEGVALVWALAFLVVVGIVVFFVLGYADTSINATSRLSNQRSALYAVDGAVNNAIRYVQNNANAGVSGNNSCPSPVALNSQSVTIQCVPTSDSGTASAPSSAPPFAILTTAPFTQTFTGGTRNPSCSTVSTQAGAELGIVQVQNDKALTVNGDVYVNSDVDADTWSNGCPNTSAARAIQVNGNAIVKESCHDLFAAAGATPPYGWYCDQNGATDPKTQGDAGRTPNGGWASAPAGLQQNLADPAIANPTAWAPATTSAPPAQSVPTCPATGNLVTFKPGTYTDAAGMTALMSGTTCKGKLFWFQPGTYYFNFSNGSNTWTVNDTAARIVGGTPNAVSSGATTVGPVTVSAANPPAPTTGIVGSQNPGYSNPTNAVTINNQAATTGNFTTSNQQRWITTGGYAISPSIPTGATGLTVTARIVHNETYGNPSQIASLQLLVNDVNDANTRCTVPVVPATPSNTPTDVTVAIPNGCLDAATLNSGAFKLRFQIAHTACNGGSCASISSALDGIELKVSYTTPARAAWSPSDPASVTANSPSVPGACIHDGDYGFGPSTGVQFIFGGSSHVVLKSGAWELCPSFSSNHQEIVMYGVRSLSGGGSSAATWSPTNYTNGNPGFTNPANGVAGGGGGATAALSSGTSTRTMSLTQFTPTSWPIPNTDQIPAGSTINSVTLSVTHSESNTSQTSPSTVNVSCGAINLPEHTSLSADPVDVTSCLNTPAKLNSGVTAQFTARRNSNSPTVTLDGMSLSITYTPPVNVGSLNPASGCITQAPYYNPTNHQPGYNGACALFSVASNTNGGTAPRVAVFWGTVYAPSAALDVPVDVLSVPVFDRGVVARMLMLGYNVATNAQVPISSTPITANIPNNREVTFTATIPGASTKLEADVVFCDSTFDPRCAGTAAGGAKVQSWKVTR